MKKLPTFSGNTTNAEKGEKSPFKISAALLDFLQQFKYSPRGKSAKPTAPRRKLAIEPGKSVSAADLEGTDSRKVKSTKANDAPLAPSPSESSDSDSECESSVGPEPLISACMRLTQAGALEATLLTAAMQLSNFPALGVRK